MTSVAMMMAILMLLVLTDATSQKLPRAPVLRLPQPWLEAVLTLAAFAALAALATLAAVEVGVLPASVLARGRTPLGEPRRLAEVLRDLQALPPQVPRGPPPLTPSFIVF